MRLPSGKNVASKPSDEYTKLLQTTVNTVATQTEADQSEEEEEEGEPGLSMAIFMTFNHAEA